MKQDGAEEDGDAGDGVEDEDEEANCRAGWRWFIEEFRNGLPVVERNKGRRGKKGSARGRKGRGSDGANGLAEG
jgi:hypothetical protein